jgi:hypothetical protein
MKILYCRYCRILNSPHPEINWHIGSTTKLMLFFMTGGERVSKYYPRAISNM